MADEKAVIYKSLKEAQYDATAKLLLAQKPFLANILVHTVKDEGVVYFDIVFYVRTPGGLSKIIINIEAQKSEPTMYDVEMRGLFYAAREVSSQLEREFSNQKYNDIKKVYSIWICMNETDNTLEKIYLTKKDIIGQSRWKEMYEMINVVIIRLGKELDEQKNHELHRLLGALFLPEMTADEKNDLLENEFHIQMEGDRKEMLHTMCNLSQGIKEQGIEQGIETGIKKGRSSEIFESVQEGDYSIERGAQKMNLSVEEFEKSMIEAGYEIPSVIP